jgi:REP element-mobilizing transposase RayT
LITFPDSELTLIGDQDTKIRPKIAGISKSQFQKAIKYRYWLHELTGRMFRARIIGAGQSEQVGEKFEVATEEEV